MMRRFAIPLTVVVALFVAACGGSDDVVAARADQTSEAEPAASEDASTDVTPAPAADEQAIAESEPTSETEPIAAPEPTAAPESSAATEAAEAGSAVGGCGAGSVGGTTTQTFEFEGRERTFEQVLPTSYDDVSPLPVVLNWHGLGSNGAEQVAFSDYATHAEAEGFILIAPTGVPTPGDTRNSWELEPSQDPTRDDLAFANALLDLVIDTLCVDQARVYSTGMSNGGYFTSVLVCHMSDRIAAAASVAALSRPDDCDPQRPVPYIGFHGTDDQVVPYAGGGESSLAPGEIVDLFLLEIGDEFAEFAEDAGCAVEPVVSELSPAVTSFDYPECPDDVAMTFYKIEGGGHTWPGSIVSLAISEAAGLGPTTAEISATETSWSFFRNYSLDD